VAVFNQDRNMHIDIKYKIDPASATTDMDRPGRAAAKAAAKQAAKRKRKSQDQLLLEAAQRNKAERKAGQSPTIEIFC
jgi:hypothetical protein